MLLRELRWSEKRGGKSMEDAGELCLWWCSTIVSRTCGSTQTSETHYLTHGGVPNTHSFDRITDPRAGPQGQIVTPMTWNAPYSPMQTRPEYHRKLSLCLLLKRGCVSCRARCDDDYSRMLVPPPLSLHLPSCTSMTNQQPLQGSSGRGVGGKVCCVLGPRSRLPAQHTRV